MAFVGDWFYVGNTDRVLRFPCQKGQQKLAGPSETVTLLPGQGYNQHWTRNVIPGPDGGLFVSVGSETNVGIEAPPRAAVTWISPDGTGRHLVASGLRNPVGLAVSPKTKELYATVNERDELGDGLVPDYLAHVEPGAFYGWPYAYLKPDLLDPRHVQDGKSVRPDLAAKTTTPDVLFEPHSAALGLTFYTPSKDAQQPFPAKYRDGAFVAFRGSWNRSKGTGYKLVHVPFAENGRPEGGYEDFVTGFLSDPGRPQDLGPPRRPAEPARRQPAVHRGSQRPRLPRELRRLTRPTGADRRDGVRLDRASLDNRRRGRRGFAGEAHGREARGLGRRNARPGASYVAEGTTPPPGGRPMPDGSRKRRHSPNQARRRWYAEHRSRRFGRRFGLGCASAA